jgi:hypothetical protein
VTRFPAGGGSLWRNLPGWGWRFDIWDVCSVVDEDISTGSTFMSEPSVEPSAMPSIRLNGWGWIGLIIASG